MNPSILISSTESIEGMRIEKYFDLISTNVVLGTNVFSDIGASFSDFFGGASDIYQNKLEKIYKIGLDKLKRKAQQVGANGIIGIRLDFDEVGGKGKSMFMLSVTGMAVRLKPIEGNKIQGSDFSNDVILPEALDDQIKKLSIKRKISNREIISQEEWDFLLENPLEEILDGILEIYLFAFKNGPTAIYDNQKMLRNYFPAFLLSISQDKCSGALYSRLSQNPEVVSTLIQESKSFAPDKALGLLHDGGYHNLILTLQSDKRAYNIQDLKLMEIILDGLNNLPNTGKNESVKSLLGSPKEKFICEKNHQNDSISEFCYTEGCKVNIKGLIRSEVKKVENFKLKVEALRNLLS